MSVGIEAPADARAAANWLRTPGAVRERAHAMLRLAERGELRHFSIDRTRLGPTADFVSDVIAENYPDLNVPYHARWRHFSAGGRDRWARLADTLRGESRAEIARTRIDLCVTSVLLDAGAGGAWRYVDEHGDRFSRSEGLAVASFEAFADGVFSGDRTHRLRADAKGLASITAADIERLFQVTRENPLLGVEGRAALMRSLGAALLARPDMFGRRNPRIGNLFDRLAAAPQVSAPDILAAILDAFSGIWPSRLTLGGCELGDVWRHPQAAADDLTSGLVPFHKLSQWLAYSLVEVFEDAGLRVTELERLTGLPEYRNGGLMIDMGLLVLKDRSLANAPLRVDHPAVVEWRALTVALLDELLEPVRQRLGRPDMPLACLLEGGTWAAGRKIAAARRTDGGPPLTVQSDGTVF